MDCKKPIFDTDIGSDIDDALALLLLLHLQNEELRGVTTAYGDRQRCARYTEGCGEAVVIAARLGASGKHVRERITDVIRQRSTVLD